MLFSFRLVSKGVFFAVIILLWSCSPTPSSSVTSPGPQEDEMEFRQLDTLVVTAPRVDGNQEIEDLIRSVEERVYQATYEKKANLVHTLLDLSFGWEDRTVRGQATLTITPYFYDLEELRLDAKNFDLYSVTLGSEGKALNYEYDGVELHIDLGETYSSGDTFDIHIDYKAFPYRQRADGFQPAGIQRGIYFINHTGEEHHTPMQIWTQGQTEYNSNWFPTIDKPNVRTTQETILTVEDRFTTLCNGLLVSSEKLEDDMRRDHWVMDMAHPPYLFMVAVGEYQKVEEEWNGIPVEYFVEEDYEEYAADIFGHTLEMMDFFSERTGIDYPWPKYSQVVVRDFVAGAMENTTAVIYGEQVQRPGIDLVDRNNDGIVAHELIHHWFGNMVTCENWASLTLNEGFASFAEYLWEEYKYGPDRAGQLRVDKLNAYFHEAANYVRPLINFGYDDNEEMFDRHSYNKGGLVLQMLRHYVGDEAFFASWNRYLVDNMFSAVEVHDLRLAFEEVTGKDLNWFFDQWFFEKGHPQIYVKTQYDSVSATLGLTIQQIQDPVEWHPVFQFPVKVDVHLEDGWVIELDMMVNQRETTLLLDCPAPPLWVNFDRDKNLLAEVEMERDMDSYLAQYQLGETFLDRHEAAMALRQEGNELPEEIRSAFLNDNSPRIRHLALNAFSELFLPEEEERLAFMAISDDNSLVRASALRSLEMFGYPDIQPLALQVLEEAYSAATIAAALEVLYYRAPETAIERAADYENAKSRTVLMSLATIYGTHGSEEHIDFFKANYFRQRGFAISNFFTRFSELLLQLPPETAFGEIEWLKNRAMDTGEGTFVRYGATTAINDQAGRFKELLETDEADREFLQSAVTTLDENLKEILESEPNPRVRNMIQNIMGQ